jgi:hypothetical protein
MQFIKTRKSSYLLMVARIAPFGGLSHVLGKNNGTSYIVALGNDVLR